MSSYLESVLKYSSVCGWKHTLARMVGSYDNTCRANWEEKKDGMDPNEKVDEFDMKERLGGWWW